MLPGLPDCLPMLLQRRTDGRVLRIDQGSMPADLGFVVIQMVRNIKPFGSIADILVLSEYPLIPLWPTASYIFSP